MKNAETCSLPWKLKKQVGWGSNLVSVVQTEPFWGFSAVVAFLMVGSGEPRTNSTQLLPQKPGFAANNFYYALKF